MPSLSLLEEITLALLPMFIPCNIMRSQIGQLCQLSLGTPSSVKEDLNAISYLCMKGLIWTLNGKGVLLFLMLRMELIGHIKRMAL
jgi:hypothetical protein